MGTFPAIVQAFLLTFLSSQKAIVHLNFFLLHTYLIHIYLIHTYTTCVSLRKQGPLNQQDLCMYELIDSEAACTGLKMSAPSGILGLKEVGTSINQTHIQSPIDNLLQMKT